MKRIKIAQIGTSNDSHGACIFRSIAKQTDVFEVVGYALPENEREKFPGKMDVFNGYREMTVEEILNSPEIEAVAVETEEIYLTKYCTVDEPSKKIVSPSFIRRAAFLQISLFALESKDALIDRGI